MSTHATTRRIAFAAVTVLIAVAIGVYALMSKPQPGQRSFGEALVGGPFTMVNQKGETVTEKSFAGKPMLLFFGYTYCPDVCPTELQVMAEALRQLGDKASDIQPILVSIDPARDTPQVLADYVTVFDPSFIGLHGSEEQVQQLMKQYGVTAVRKDLPGSALGYTIDHTAFVHVIDQSGRWREQFPFGASAEDMAGDVRQLIRSGGRL